MAFESLLEKLKREWQDRGWSPEDLLSFRMEGEGDPPDPDADPDDDPDPDDDDDPDIPVVENGVVKITQKAMTKVMTRERTKGKRSATRDLLKKYGLKDEKDLEAIMTERKTREDSTKTEAEKAKAEAEEAKKTAEEATNSAKRERFETKLERRLTKAGIQEKRVDKAIKLMDLDDLDMSDEDLQDEVEEFMKDYPEWFVNADDDDDEDKNKRKPRTPGTKVPGQPRKPGEPTAADKAKATLAKRHPRTVKSST